MFAKTLAVGKGFSKHGTCQGEFPLDPYAARLPAQALRYRPAAGWTWALPTGKH